MVFSAGFLLTSTPDGVARSSDEGLTWTVSNDGFAKNATGHNFLGSLHATNQSLLAASSLDTGYIYRSVDNGSTWLPVHSGHFVFHICHTPNAVFAAGHTLILKSTDDGQHWTQTADSAVSIIGITAKGPFLFIAGLGGVKRSSDDGVSWQQTPITELMTTFAVTDSEVFAGSDFGGVYRSTDDGASWEKGDLDSVFVSTILATGQGVYVATEKGIYGSMDRGHHWIFRGLQTTDFFHPLTPAIALAASPANLFALNDNHSAIWSRPLLTLSVHTRRAEEPDESGLSGTYPNPFNGQTTIGYRLAERSTVTITIHDVLGRSLAGLVEGEMSAGNHEVRWDAGRYASGVYYVRMTTPRSASTGKIVIAK